MCGWGYFEFGSIMWVLRWCRMENIDICMAAVVVGKHIHKMMGTEDSWWWSRVLFGMKNQRYQGVIRCFAWSMADGGRSSVSFSCYGRHLLVSLAKREDGNIVEDIRRWTFDYFNNITNDSIIRSCAHSTNTFWSHSGKEQSGRRKIFRECSDIIGYA